MTPEALLLESNALRDLKRLSEERGLEFHINPSRDLIPPFLAGYQPDAIARRPDGGGIIIEVKRQRTGSSDRQLSEISKRVSAQKGWEFRVIYVNPAAEVPIGFARPTREQITARLEETEALAKTGHRGSALILGWAVLEALARLVVAHDEAERSGPFSPLQAVQTLAEEGYLEHDAAQSLRQMVTLRNAVMHGDFSADISAEQVESLLEQLQAIASDIVSVEREQNAEGLRR